jgi:hypothetical protein
MSISLLTEREKGAHVLHRRDSLREGISAFSQPWFKHVYQLHGGIMTYQQEFGMSTGWGSASSSISG